MASDVIIAAPVAAKAEPAGVGPWRAALGRFLRNRGAQVGSVLLLAWIFAAVAAPLIAPYDPNGLVARARQAPSALHWFGTDGLGRDVLSRIIYGSRISLALGAISRTIERSVLELCDLPLPDEVKADSKYRLH